MTSPRQIPRHRWWHIAKRVYSEIGADRLTLAAAGVAFFSFLAIFPAMVALTSIWGLVADPTSVESQMASFIALLPEGARDLMLDQAVRIAGSSEASLGFGTALALAITLWSANKGMKGLLDGLNLAYDREETRGFVRNNMLTLVLTLGAILLTVTAIALVILVPVALNFVGFGGAARLAVDFLRWPLLAIMVLFALTVLYRIGPVDHDPGWRWASPGSVLATLLWLSASIGFSSYVANFGSYDRFYGSIAAVVILLIWFFISAFIVLLGAEVNAETERESTGSRDLRGAGAARNR